MECKREEEWESKKEQDLSCDRSIDSIALPNSASPLEDNPESRNLSQQGTILEHNEPVVLNESN